MKTIYIKSEVQRKTALGYIEDLPISPVHVVEIKEYKEPLSGRQRRLYFKWLEEIAKHRGEDYKELHLKYKEDYLINIFIRDDESFSAMYETIREVYRKGMKTDAVLLRKWVVEHTSITDTDTKQMSEYMKCIEVEATMSGVSLTHPEEYDVNLGD